MKLRPDQLAAHLDKGLAPLYLVTGDEPLLVAESCDAIRAKARAAGCSERLVFNVESGFDWSGLLEARDNLSLFAEQRLIELRLPSGKPGDAGSKVLMEYVSRLPQGDVLLVISGKLDKDSQRTKWFGALEQAGVVIQIWPVESGALPGWITARMRAKGLQPSTEAAVLLAERVEGNLLACAQEIEKLALLHGSGPVAVDEVAAAVADSARYSVYDLADRALAGDAAACVRVLHGLRGEGEEPVLILWALTREIRTLTQMRAALAQGQAADRVFADFKIWDKRQPLVRAALKRHPLAACQALLSQAGNMDRLIKGAAAGHVWDELLQLTLTLAGVDVIKRGGAQAAG